MKKNMFIKIGILFIVTGFIFLFIEQLSFFIEDYNNDIEKSKEIASLINNNYDLFNQKAKKYRDDISSVYKLFDVYLDDFLLKNEAIISSIEKVNTDIDDIAINVYKLDGNCHYDLSNNLLSEKCDMFYFNYKSMFDSYNNMIKEYNKLIEVYNDYALKKGVNKLSLYNSNLDSKLYRIYENM